MGKIFWFDTETTGLDPRINDIHQLAYIIDIDNEVKEEGSIYFRPFNLEATEGLSISGQSIEKVTKYPPARESFNVLLSTLEKYVNKYDKQDKFIMAGYNVNFDIQFLRCLWDKLHEKYFGSWFFYPFIDVVTFVATQVQDGLRLSDYKLSTLCSEYGIELDAHEALSDIRATRELHRILLSQ